MSQNSIPIPIPIPQLGAAMALVQLLTEYPHLPHASWSVALDTGSLHGHIHTASFESLTGFAAVLGGSIRPGQDFPVAGRMMRPHRLHSMWRDVRVEVVAVLPAPVQTAVAA
ncbi:hypothetical protein [Streptomyces sp. BE230]|uniref:hypothetical protein n=1 Tax=Streptomyces sp. BE230 TaxID=3002526 RepID=UPI002ED4F320|nr:hypothetical protein [Streptomyces sp. BE230]